jgi:hypothetical protein
MLLLYADPFRIDWTRCPIVISDRFDLRRQLGVKIEFFTSITEVTETPKFQKSLDKLDRSVKRMWLDQKRKLAQTVSLNSLGRSHLRMAASSSVNCVASSAV